MYRRIGLRGSEDGYVLTLTPSQFELVRRVMVDLYGGSHSPEVVAVVAGDVPVGFLNLWARDVDPQSRSSLDIPLDQSELRAVWGALAFAIAGRSSEEAFHERFGFYSENVQAVVWAITGALQAAGRPAE